MSVHIFNPDDDFAKKIAVMSRIISYSLYSMYIIFLKTLVSSGTMEFVSSYMKWC